MRSSTGVITLLVLVVLFVFEACHPEEYAYQDNVGASPADLGYVSQSSLSEGDGFVSSEANIIMAVGDAPEFLLGDLFKDNEKIEEEISGSFGSWMVEKAISIGALHSKELKEIETTGEKEIHAKDPVFPPTQLPQLSVKAVPFGAELQSSG